MNPVALRPGRAKLSTYPAPTGSVTIVNTIGMLKRPFIPASEWPRQCLLAQYIGIAFARLGKLNDLDGDGLSDAIVTVASPQSNAGHLEGDGKNPRRMMDMRTPVVGNSVSEQTRDRPIAG